MALLPRTDTEERGEQAAPGAGQNVGRLGLPKAIGSVDRILTLATLQSRRQAEVRRLARTLDDVQRVGIREVGGEADLIARLTGLLDEATELLETLKPAHQEEFADQLDKAILLLNGPEWALVDFIRQELATKHQSQMSMVTEAREELQRLRRQVEEMREQLQTANRVNAPVRKWSARLQQRNEMLRQADRARDGEDYIGLMQAVDRLRDLPQLIQEMNEDLSPKVRQAALFSRHADLLLMQFPLDEQKNRYQYDILLRTPSLPGTPGINVQDSSTLVKPDRDWMDSVIGKISQAFSMGTTRSAAPAGTAGPAGSPGSAESAGAAGSASGTGEDAGPNPSVSRPAPPVTPQRLRQTRAWLMDTTGGTDSGPDTMPENVNYLVREMGNMMYRLFIPEQMQQYLRDVSCSITITTNDLELPWELMYCEHYFVEDEHALAEDLSEIEVEQRADEARYLCLCRPVARMPMGQAFPMFNPVEERRSDRIRFLLVGNPTGDLKQADREIELLKHELESMGKEMSTTQGSNSPSTTTPTSSQTARIHVETLQGPQVTGRNLNERLSSGDFDVIHYSGHAFFDDNRPDLSGLLLAGNEVFYAQKIRRLLKGQPLVFLNGCQSGTIENELRAAEAGELTPDQWRKRLFNLKKPAEGLASSFIYGGAKGCVGALWPIYDEPAARFAVEFYRNVLEGHMIGEAMRLTRRAIKLSQDSSITWAAYVLYGDPTFRLTE